MYRYLFSALTILGLAACASGPALVQGPGLEVVSMNALPPPAHVDPNSDTREYRLGPSDKIQVLVFGQPDLSREEVLIDASGSISLPMIGPLRASGLTPAQLGEEIATRLRASYVREPQVAVNLVEPLSQVMTIDGAVAQPGNYPIVGEMTLMRAVATARGVTEFARLNEVVIFRTVGEQRMAALYSLDGIRSGQYPDPQLYSGDVVVVGDSPARRLFRDIVAAGGLLTAPLVAVIRR